MAFKEYDKTPTFLDMEIQRAVSHPRNKQSLFEIDATINWEPIEPGWPPKIPHLWPLENPPPGGCF